ncbi:hypothetical protein SERLADRAFT_467840 [Serpula lacrymans var. lacrymans S7.9]|nr:uncharacterized protein SERLADRAFT_467840 [Serpula lacrymans var. lacrymans S7.9]EGO24470.1 hypothetical protein SERLADRAFT_467840 [Serpula lacrymans var. lacrymans S7.9]
MPDSQSYVDRSAVLCLACSSSLPPRSKHVVGNTDNDIFITSCCNRPICPSCLSANPRLRRYNPCLSCLGGVDVVGTASGLVSATKTPNIDGAVRDEDNFVIGDDDDDIDDGLENTIPSGSLLRSSPPPPYTAQNESSFTHTSSSTSANHREGETMEDRSNPVIEAAPSRYLIQRGDTLQGIALRLGVNGRDLCRLNNLPPSTLSTTPHLLHTRVSLVLPPSVRSLKPLPPVNVEERDKRVREQAGRRLQMLTKETDWRIAKAYVALADDPGEESSHAMKAKEIGGSSTGACSLEARAVDKYLEDVEWEEQEGRAGRKISAAHLPVASKQIRNPVNKGTRGWV